MKNFKSILLAGVLPVLMLGCAATPEKSELQRLSADEIQNALVGNTYTFKESWGRYAEYYRPDGTGIGKAWGSWGSEIATYEYSISEDGEICGTYSGDADWASGNSYCEVMYTDAEGNYYVESTKREYDKEKIGKIRNFEIKSGDAYGLEG